MKVPLIVARIVCFSHSCPSLGYFSSCCDTVLPLDGNVHVCDVVQDELDQLLVLFLADPFDERLRFQSFTKLDGSQAVFGKAEIKVVRDCDCALRV